MTKEKIQEFEIEIKEIAGSKNFWLNIDDDISFALIAETEFDTFGGVLVRPYRFDEKSSKFNEDIDMSRFMKALAVAMDIYLDYWSEVLYYDEYIHPEHTDSDLQNDFSCMDDVDLADFSSNIKRILSAKRFPIYSTEDRYLWLMQAIESETKNRGLAREQIAIQKLSKMRGPRPGFIYLIQSSSGHFKIGYTKNPTDRMATFSVKLPFEIEYKHLIPTNSMSAAERLLHQKYEHRRVVGEWFSLSEEDVEEILKIDCIEV